jgi:segregation and condensation protein B
MVESPRPDDEFGRNQPRTLGPGTDDRDLPPGDEGISLDELTRAYAQLLGKGEDPYEPPAVPEPCLAEEPAPEKSEDADQACDLCPKSIVEAVLFVGHPRNEPIGSAQIASLMRGVSPREIDELIKELNNEYAESGHPFQIVSVGPGYRLELREQFASLRHLFHGRVREARLSQASVDILAIVAYQQGLTRPEIDTLRGKPSGPLLSQLVRRRLLRMERPETKPRMPRYYTTDRFLKLFDLSSLDDLPQGKDGD